jgi:hypothetical protein
MRGAAINQTMKIDSICYEVASALLNRYRHANTTNPTEIRFCLNSCVDYWQKEGMTVRDYSQANAVKKVQSICNVVFRLRDYDYPSNARH